VLAPADRAQSEGESNALWLLTGKEESSLLAPRLIENAAEQGRNANTTHAPDQQGKQRLGRRFVCQETRP